MHHLFDHRTHFCFSQVVASILVPYIEDVSKLFLLINGPLTIDCLRVDAECMEEVLSHYSELIESEETVLISIVTIKKLLKPLDNFLFFLGNALGFFLHAFINKIVEL